MNRLIVILTSVAIGAAPALAQNNEQVADAEMGYRAALRTSQQMARYAESCFADFAREGKEAFDEGDCNRVNDKLQDYNLAIDAFNEHCSEGGTSKYSPRQCQKIAEEIYKARPYLMTIRAIENEQ